MIGFISISLSLSQTASAQQGGSSEERGRPQEEDAAAPPEEEENAAAPPEEEEEEAAPPEEEEDAAASEELSNPSQAPTQQTPQCPSGTTFDRGFCVSEPDLVCPEGYALEANGVCRSTATTTDRCVQRDMH